MSRTGWMKAGKRGVLRAVCAAAAILIFVSAVSLYAGAPAGTGPAEAECARLDCGDGQELYVLLPETYDPGREYCSVYFMPRDGADPSWYLEQGIPGRIRRMERDGTIPGMICVFVGLSGGADPEDQVREAVEAVEEAYSSIPDASKRGVIGVNAGGRLAFHLGYGLGDGEVDRVPELFCAVASHDGDFTSDANPSVSGCADIYDGLNGEVDVPNGKGTEWVRNYYTYLDACSDSALTWEQGGTADIISLYRMDNFSNHHSPSAWDYSVFEYALRGASDYRGGADRLDRSLLGFARRFGIPEAQPKEEDRVEYRVRETIVSGEDRMIDLMGDWHFITETAMAGTDPGDGKPGGFDPSRIGSVMKTDWTSWDVVQPGLDWWTADFAPCLNGNQYYSGYAWYAREFEVPEEFDLRDLQIEAGMVDEADEVYINGVRVGQTGIPEEGGAYDLSNPWDEERVYPIPDGLLKAGTNRVFVRVCNRSGGGGWYAGPIEISAARQEVDPEEAGQRFYVDSFSSDALGGTDVEYRVYLPEGYYESDLRYPVVYMLHGYGSTGKSFEIAGVPAVLDEGIACGEIPPCIVIFPTDTHPQKASWWVGAYARMLNEDLVSRIDATLRTVDSRDYRFLAGESMGGGGAFFNALDRPDLYGGVFDIYGALSYTGALTRFMNMGEDELKNLKLKYFLICGTHDMYGFDLDHIRLGRRMTEAGIPHVLDIDSGEHSSSFYLPYLRRGFAYILSGLRPL